MVTPIRNWLDQDIKDGLRRSLAARHAPVEAFVEEKPNEYTIEELMEFSAIQIHLFPTIVERNGTKTIEWPFKIICPDD
ncbi:hypothetical protein HR059_07410 [Sinorhizobium meliloti WSM1022]|uniref:hypothetical protein n=1 Tax=Rhizobium meliloti TaxID=382 RepID=UPI001573636A|nr:hypothetical protein [Sinorhizobium meliloti]QKN14300.1 hypothetical protein HR059_07410 [Sinorhizobium meliloti WSM1022]